jgi:hypothetical protein
MVDKIELGIMNNELGIDLQKDIAEIKERNKKVEIDKSWEVSLVRRGFIFLVTYITAGVWLVTIQDSYPWLKALVPAVGFILSTLTLPPIKKWWTKNKK